MHRVGLFAACAALVLTACEDPSNVGLGLVGETGGEPEVVTVSLQPYAPIEVRDVTGGPVSATANTTLRFFAGMVADPLIGSLDATGYVDFRTVSGISDEFRNGTVTAAELRLSRDYVYGDTTGTIEVQISEMTGTWDAVSPTDAEITAGDAITTASFAADRREVVIPLPQAWIDANSSLLRSSSFTADFGGFEIAPVEGSAVFGFSNATSRFRVIAGGDTVDYQVERSLTTTSTELLPDRDENLVWDATTHGLTLELPPSVQELGPAGVHSARIRLPADTTITEREKPAGFVRPMLDRIRITGVVDSVAAFTSEVSLSASGDFIFTEAHLPTRFFQNMIAGEDVSFILSAPPSRFSLDPILLVPPDPASVAPAVVITLTRAEL